MSAELWARLRALTPARVGLGRVGGSLPTRALLEFELAHARARDAVQTEMDVAEVSRQIAEAGFGKAVLVRGRARDRTEYLLRPDLGRRLDEESRERLLELKQRGGWPAGGDSAGGVVVVFGDGLSGRAPETHALAVLQAWREGVGAAGNVPATPVIVAKQARVALGDEIGELLGAAAVVMLIGERPGLSSPDSLGIYVTWAPRVGRSDAERNCLSNVRPEGLSYAEAARRLAYLLGEARRLGVSGIALKDDSGTGVLEPTGRSGTDQD